MCLFVLFLCVCFCVYIIIGVLGSLGLYFGVIEVLRVHTWFRGFVWVDPKYPDGVCALRGLRIRTLLITTVCDSRLHESAAR